MRLRFSDARKSFTGLSSMLSMVLILLLSAPSAFCEASGSSRPPSLNRNRLQHAYTPHKRGAERTISALKWSPDGRHAFYTIREGPDPEDGESWNTLFSVRRDGSQIRKLFVWQDPGADHPDEDSIRWSPDSSRVIMLVLNFSPASSVNADGVQLIDIDPETKEKRKLSRALGGKPETGSILNRPDFYSFSPNGKYLLLTLGGNRQTMTNKRLVRIDYATGERKLLTPFGTAAFDARWSPDGRHIVYAAQPDAGVLEGTPKSDWEADYKRRMQQQHLYIMDADGCRQRRLTKKRTILRRSPSGMQEDKSSPLFAVNSPETNLEVSGPSVRTAPDRPAYMRYSPNEFMSQNISASRNPVAPVA